MSFFKMDENSKTDSFESRTALAFDTVEYDDFEGETDDADVLTESVFLPESTNKAVTAGRRPLFKQEPLPGLMNSALGNQLSLSQYISKHLGEAPTPDTPETAPEPLQFRDPRQPRAKDTSPGFKPTGQFLNSLDGDLTAGLEQYMPTPVFRLRVVKKRIDGELSELQARLNNMTRLHDQSPEMKEGMRRIRLRIMTLQKHQRNVDYELSAMLTMGPSLYGVSRGMQAGEKVLTEALNRIQDGLGKIVFGPAREQVVSLRQDLTTLTEVMADRMADRQVSDNEISHLLNRYETTLRQLETASERLQSETVWSRLRDAIAPSAHQAS